MELFCVQCGWRGSENETKFEKWPYCKKCNIKIQETIKNEKGEVVPYCRYGRHIVSEKDIGISKRRSQKCPKCGADRLIEVNWEPVNRIETTAKITEQGLGMMMERTVIEFLDDGFCWFNGKKKDLRMSPILPPESPLTKQMQLKKGEKFRVIFERIKD